MARKPITVTVTVYRVTRRNNSVNGGPAYTLHTDNGQYKTQSDTQQAWAMSNTFPIDSTLNGGDGVKATLTLTPAGRVYAWELVEDPAFNTTARDLAWAIGRALGLIHWDAVSRVDYAVAELEINHASITPKQAAEIERCIAADIKAGK